MTNAIIEKIIADLPAYLNEGIVASAPDWLESIERGPLQDDPTTRAFYLVIDPDVERGFREPVLSISQEDVLTRAVRPSYELGGPFLMVNYFILSGWTPRATTKEANAAMGGKVLRRMERALTRMARDRGFQRCETDDGEETTAGVEQSFTIYRGRFTDIGGENEWYCRVTLQFQIFSAIRNRYWRE